MPRKERKKIIKELLARRCVDRDFQILPYNFNIYGDDDCFVWPPTSWLITYITSRLHGEVKFLRSSFV